MTRSGAIATLGAPVVVKASGLAAGKGVIICETRRRGQRRCRVDARGRARSVTLATPILVEEFMEGEELSLFVLTDGERVIALPPAQDHKRLLDGDSGPNTGGMGAYSPVSIVERSPALIGDVLDRVARPTLDAMRARGTPFEGLLYVGLMLTADGPKVVEFNCRFGDPETQAVLPALSSDVSLSELMHTVARGGLLQDDGHLARSRASLSRRCSRQPGYPEQPRSGDRIEIPRAPSDVLVFHAGTKRAHDGSLVTAGGRVLADHRPWRFDRRCAAASQRFAAEVSFEGKQFRTRHRLARARLGVPELPETETIARDLDRAIAGAGSSAFASSSRDVLREVGARAFASRVSGATIERRLAAGQARRARAVDR